MGKSGRNSQKKQYFSLNPKGDKSVLSRGSNRFRGSEMRRQAELTVRGPQHGLYTKDKGRLARSPPPLPHTHTDPHLHLPKIYTSLPSATILVYPFSYMGLMPPSPRNRAHELLQHLTLLPKALIKTHSSHRVVYFPCTLSPKLLQLLYPDSQGNLAFFMYQCSPLIQVSDQSSLPFLRT